MTLANKRVHVGTLREIRDDVARAFALWNDLNGGSRDQSVAEAPAEDVETLWEACWEHAASAVGS